MKKIPETKARMVRWGRMWPMLLSTKPMNMKKRLTRGKGVAERIISGRRQEKLISLFGTELEGCADYTVVVMTNTRFMGFFCFVFCIFSSVAF